MCSLVKVPAEATAVMPLDEVRPGMRGVCLTVFSGTAIEPFEVEVVSVVRRSGPQRAVIWLRSEDPRMLESGPVQGMSGSPVYLWKDAEPDDPEAPLGGGRLIGAFAYGFAFAKGCLIGVQPIEQMVGVGERDRG
ncbi:SpoIVB peptidase S55 domain-containing protein [Mucisphaera sp.]|uniref:SpoIVB peptidase S55 domain-containing protein n=1 Tax=Mucisphaera sp. TaxID=2913024 RepID=UPI003D0A4F41